MSMRKMVAVACATVLISIGLCSVAAEGKTLRRTYTDVRVLVVKKHGKRAAGRNIRRYGVKIKTGTRPASNAELARSIRVLRRLVHPQQYLVPVGAGPPAVPPAGVLTARYAPTGTAACIVQAESSGNPTASNPSGHSGLAGWSSEAWSRMGGTRYAPTPTQASYQQQLQVLNQGLAKYGTGDWKPYDGCG